MFRRLSAPVMIQWEVTPSCNLSCLHCYNHWRDASQAEDCHLTSREHHNNWKEAVVEIIRNEVFSVVVTGGEPLIVIRHLSKFLKLLSDQGVRLTLNTNATLLDDEAALLLKECGIASLLVSLPSHSEEVNDLITQTPRSWERTCSGIEVAMRNNIAVTINMVVSQPNLGQVMKTAQFVQGLGVNNFAATRVASPENCPDFSHLELSNAEFDVMLTELLQVEEQLGLKVDSLEFYPYCAFSTRRQLSTFGSRMCSAGKTSCTIGHDGQIRPCSRSSFVYGNISDGLGEAWTKMEPWRNGELNPEECQNCKLLGACGGGCKVNAFQTTGRLDKPDPVANLSNPLLTRAKTEPVVISVDTFELNPRLNLRAEEFGGILHVKSGNWVPVNQELFSLFEEAVCKGKEVMHIEEIAAALGVSVQEAKETISYLVSKRILREEVSHVARNSVLVR